MLIGTLQRLGGRQKSKVAADGQREKKGIGGQTGKQTDMLVLKAGKKA
jgi:hypothetical protein